MIIAVIDGMGGGIGAQIVTLLRQQLPLDVEILALGTSAIATERMMRARASRGASGENAIRVSVNLADVIIGPIGIVIPDSMMGEVTATVAQSVSTARGLKLLLPIGQPHVEIVGVEPRPLNKHIAAVIQTLRERYDLGPGHAEVRPSVP